MTRNTRTGIQMQSIGLGKNEAHTVLRTGRRTWASLLTLACLAAGLGGCTAEQPGNTVKNVFDYLNLRNSLMNPSEVGRFDKERPWSDVRPVKWPILEQLDVIDEPSDRWTNASDPTPADIIPDQKEYILSDGDTVRISVFELVVPGTEYQKEVQINELGSLTLQNLGAIKAAGLTSSQLEEKIGQVAVEKNLLLPKGNGNQGPQVSVTLLQSHARVFSILGAVGHPGTYNVLGNEFRMLDALALAGDIPVQPGMDYIYVIRQSNYRAGDVTTTSTTGTTPGDNSVTKPARTGSNPLEDIESIERKAPSTAPSTGPGSMAPTLVRPLPAAMVVSGNASTGIEVAAGNDLDAALNDGTTSAPATTTAPAKAVATTASSTAAPVATTAPADDLLNNAMGSSTTQKTGNYVYIDGKWVLVPATTAPATAAEGTPATGTTSTGTTAAGTPAVAIPPATSSAPAAIASASEEKISQQRVIRIPINALREGVTKYNIIVRPGDIINVPSVEPGEFYMMGNIGRPGVYSLTGRKITLKMAVAAAGNLGALAIPRRCELIRRVGPNQEATVQVNLQKIFDGDQPDIFLKPNDVLNVGTDMVAPFLAVTRNAYRASYGWGFVFDRNFAPAQSTSSGG